MRNHPYPAEPLLPEVIRNPVFHLFEAFLHAFLNLFFFKPYFPYCNLKFIPPQIAQPHLIVSPFRIPQVNVP